MAKDIKHGELTEKPTPYLYLPYLQSSWPLQTLLVRASGDPSGLISLVGKEVHSLDPNLPLFKAMPLTQYVLREQVDKQEAIATLLSLLGSIALLLATSGIYGVMAHAVSQRTREIGIRMALGAHPRDVLKLVLRQGMGLVTVGLGVGAMGAVCLSRLLSSLLIGVSPTDPVSFALVSVMLRAVAMLACYIPACRAAQVAPIVALRYE
jgi:ABC-type antimicrobial peptide transport system permease subunit